MFDQKIFNWSCITDIVNLQTFIESALPSLVDNLSVLLVTLLPKGSPVQLHRHKENCTHTLQVYLHLEDISLMSWPTL